MKRNIMATSQLLTHTEMFDEMIVGVITNLRRKYQRANCERMHKEIAEWINEWMNEWNLYLTSKKYNIATS